MVSNKQPGDDEQYREGDEFERWLTGQLRQKEPYLDDGGFADRVVTALPERRASHLFFYGIFSVVLFIAAIVVAWHLPWLGLLIDLVVSLSLLNKAALLSYGVLFAAVSTAVGVWGLRRG